MQEKRTINATTLKQWCESGKKVTFIDIRNTDEYKHEHIKHATCVPLSSLSKDVLEKFTKDECIVVHCQRGRRTCDAEPVLQQFLTKFYILEGGIEAWKNAGGKTQTGEGPLPIPRQVFIGVGSLVLLTQILSWTVNPWFSILTAFFGAGLIFAGSTGFCLLAKMLEKLPYNKK